MDRQWRGPWYGPGERGRMMAWVHTMVTVVLVVLLWVQSGAKNNNAEIDSRLAESFKVDGEKVVVPEETRNQAEMLQIRIDRKERELEGTRKELRAAEKKLDKCKKELQESQASSSSGDEVADLEEEVKKLKSRDAAMQDQIKRATGAVALLSRQVLKMKFEGHPEPFRAQMTVVFPESMGEPREGEIEIEFASSDLVPTGVLYFMNQIEAGLWNGCSFIRNAGHVLQASAQSPSKQPLHHRFKSLPYQKYSIPFQEYSKDFPHEKYTLGLAGRPGGVDFYISTVDNTRNHGPGGQGSYDLPEEADTCFAKVVNGFDVVDRMHKAPAARHGFESLIEYIEIKNFELI